MVINRDNPEPEERFNAAVGRAVMTWGYVEWLHSELFQQVATGQAGNQPLVRAYWAIVSFEGKHKMVDAAMREALSKHPGFLARWINISNRLQRKSRVRNKLAHGTLVSPPRHKSGDQLALVAAVYSKTEWPPEDELLLAEVLDTEASFTKLGNDMLELQRDHFVEFVREGRKVRRFQYPEELPPSG
ncbi:hypothetical protein [Mesorhizobium sp. Cs1321R2N1]|uniref:hypothetical protein n=1 Tax=Mesorhizobium sp. Cs1321R2N1 TaxID=3015174 RepID=UPI00301BADB3